jgi:hypothetical protein
MTMNPTATRRKTRTLAKSKYRVADLPPGAVWAGG